MGIFSETSYDSGKEKKKKPQAPAKPTYKPLPKAPDMSASLAVWQRYEKRVKQVMKENFAKKADYLKKRKAYETAKNLRERIKKDAKKAYSRLNKY